MCLTIQEILKSTDNNCMLRVRSIPVVFFIFGIIFTSIHGGRGAPLPPPEELLTTSTVPLENLSLGNNITTSTIDASVGPPSDIKIIAGVAPDLEPAIPEYIAELSRPEISKCTYHVQLPQVADQQITDIAIVNTGNQTVKFSSGNFATISTSTGGPLI
jgi:hypothetical protein